MSTAVSSRSLRALARLLAYPDAALRAHLTELRSVMADEAALHRRRRDEICALIDALGRQDPIDVEAAYVDLFDRGRATSLHLFEHVHGDSRDRGPAMIDLARTYEQAGLYLAPGEFPDYLPTAIEFASMQDAVTARAFIGEMMHILQAIFSALLARQSAYASLLGALIELSGGRAERVPVATDPSLDESWAEPAAFSGCSSAGQSGPGGAKGAQPVQWVRNPNPTTSRSSGVSA
ncbi:MAG: nitrate reductase molybdenum cofactor assembly chaperone [Burkholderiales bacterium]|nr:nitrate reductase molybdenum cofactor assembly chaperone [Burkholderiales bacterium]